MWCVEKCITCLGHPVYTYTSYISSLTAGRLRAKIAVAQISGHIHRVTVTSLCSISMPVNFSRHVVGRTVRNVCHCDSA